MPDNMEAMFSHVRGESIPVYDVEAQTRPFGSNPGRSSPHLADMSVR